MEKQYSILHICDYSAPYRGNFMDSLVSVEKYHSNVKNYYLFPARARTTGAQVWIDELNLEQTVAYIQEENLLKNIRLLTRILKTHKIDRIVRHFSDAKMDIITFFLFPGKKVIRFLHNGYDPKDRSLNHYLKRFFWQGNHLVGVSDAVSEDIRRALPGYRVTSIVNAIHFDRLEQQEPIPKPDCVSMLMMGWEYERKGVDLAVAACHRLRGKYDFQLRVIALHNEDKVRQIVRNITGEDAAWVSFLPGTNFVGTYYRANDIFLSPSRQEAFGYANIEAAYCENSVVLSRVDGQAQLKLDGAYWFESENIDALTEQLEKALLEVHTSEKIVQRTQVKEQVERIYSLEEWGNQLVSIL